MSHLLSKILILFHILRFIPIFDRFRLITKYKPSPLLIKFWFVSTFLVGDDIFNFGSIKPY